MRVEETTDYSIFKYLLGNRAIDENNKNRIKSSIEKKNLFSPIVVNEKMEIVDGQHRFAARSELGLPIQYIIVEGYDQEEVSILNSNSKNWSMMEYIRSYAKQGYSEYIKLLEIINEYNKLPSSIVIGCCAGTVGGHRSDLKNGKFKFANESKTSSILNHVLDFKDLFDGYNKTSFVNAIIQIIREKGTIYDREQMKHKASVNPDKMYDCTSTNNAVIMLEDLYNFKSHNKISLRY